MTKRLLIGLCLLALPTLASADTLTFVWDPAAGATSYDIERATTFNAITGVGTWAVLANVPASACVGTPVECRFTDAAAPATGAYYRIAPRNAAGVLPLTKKGLWYCGVCPELPAKPIAVGVVQ
jgi:hypothetical protein